MTDNELTAALCLRVGMIMEDVCADAVTVNPYDAEQLAEALERLRTASARIAGLLTGAAALLGDYASSG